VGAMEVLKLRTNVDVKRKGVKIAKTELLHIMGIRINLLIDAGNGTAAETNLIQSITEIWEEILSVYANKK